MGLWLSRNAQGGFCVATGILDEAAVIDASCGGGRDVSAPVNFAVVATENLTSAGYWVAYGRLDPDRADEVQLNVNNEQHTTVPVDRSTGYWIATFPADPSGHDEVQLVTLEEGQAVDVLPLSNQTQDLQVKSRGVV